MYKPCDLLQYNGTYQPSHYIISDLVTPSPHTQPTPAKLCITIWKRKKKKKIIPEGYKTPL